MADLLTILVALHASCAFLVFSAVGARVFQGGSMGRLSGPGISITELALSLSPRVDAIKSSFHDCVVLLRFLSHCLFLLRGSNRYIDNLILITIGGEILSCDPLPSA